MSTFNLEIEVGAWLSETGVKTTVYIGQGADMPAVETHETYIELIERSLTAYTIIDGEIILDHYAEVKEFLDGLKHAYEYAEKKAKEYGYDEATSIN